MNILAVILLGLVVLVNCTVVQNTLSLNNNIAYGYLSKVGLLLANEIRRAEEDYRTSNTSQEHSAKITDGFAARLGEFPYQAGLIADFAGGQSVCGGSLLNERRVLTAAHCWYDGIHTSNRFTVVLGSITLFRGGLRLQTSQVVLHNKYNPLTVCCDISMVYLPKDIQFSNIISPVALPSGDETDENLVGSTAIISGFGLTGDGAKISSRAYLSHATLKIISNSQCRQIYQIIRPSIICAKGISHTSICGGDSGGPLVVATGNRRVLVGVTSFGSSRSCHDGLPGGFTRVSSFTSWINNQL